MRQPKYLSPTSVHKFLDDTEEFFLRYLSDIEIPRMPQTQPMSIGSAFDAYCKSYLHERLFGVAATQGSQFELDAIFEEQVEPHNRDWARQEGEHVFEEYKKAGCLADLMLELNQAVGKPLFEFSIQDEISTDVGDIPLLGKPDVFFVNSQGARVIYDWKVNGYCSSRLTSPMKGYIKLRNTANKQIKTHKDCVLINTKGIMINAAMFLEDGNKAWADQLTIYSWLLGEPIGSEQVIFGIDQITGPANGLRFATHRLRVRPDFQYQLLEVIKMIWNAILTNHIFMDLGVDESRARGELLESMHKNVSVLNEDEKATFDSLVE